MEVTGGHYVKGTDPGIERQVPLDRHSKTTEFKDLKLLRVYSWTIINKP
jgi:hypothetical protein